MKKEERIKMFKSLTSEQRQELILKKMKAKEIEVGSGVPEKNIRVKRFMSSSILPTAFQN